jgi:UDP-N-acetylglucosamine--N-acetylmuramyl-(pentapeptide) pyrophosphoryl-undecaprenol N-acetylglucosamine transferase
MSKAKQSPLIILAAGGTGGHIFPAESVQEALEAKGCRTLFVTDSRYFRYRPDAKGNSNLRIIQAAPMVGGLPKKIRGLFFNLLGLYQSLFLLVSSRPSAIIGFGGYPSFPVLVAAALLNIPIIIHEQNAVLGKVNRFFSKFAKKLLLGLPECSFIPAGVQSLYIGNPVRAMIQAQKDIGYIAPTQDKPIHLLIVGGSQGARIFDQIIPDALMALPEALKDRLHVTEQCSIEMQSDIALRYQQHGIEADLQPFFRDIAEKIVQSHLVIARAGASTIAELTTIGRPAIFIPYPYATFDHQRLNAESLVEKKAAWCFNQQSLTSEILAKHIADLCTHPTTLYDAAAQAKALGRADAASRAAIIVIEVAQ